MKNANTQKKLQEAHGRAVAEGMILMALVSAFKNTPKWRILRRLRVLYALRQQEGIARQAARAHQAAKGRLR